MNISPIQTNENGLSQVVLSTPTKSKQTNGVKSSWSNVFHLIKVSLSSTLGIGVFIIAGYVVKYVAGPSTILSVLIAAFIAFLAGVNQILNFIVVNNISFSVHNIFPAK